MSDASLSKDYLAHVKHAQAGQCNIAGQAGQHNIAGAYQFTREEAAIEAGELLWLLKELSSWWRLLALTDSKDSLQERPPRVGACGMATPSGYGVPAEFG